MCYKQKCKVVSLNLAHPVVDKNSSNLVGTSFVIPDAERQLGRHFPRTD